ncbi:MAG: glycoside-pentoside-hexuronide (GPH):cation symporter [Bacteroides sp.]|nr:glycoside-pentoside-hexuronide (GPH):cation symporter [Bacillota bacterium]MCM1393796.1 glycoside-pentoside-hexuronide (GPH):cation symporter [[Eubacterium] siraeum]MCM1455115.1 glycoside-pentoside-hexuronide (GPH):cation symporter [Bacteroides sp.]
MSKEENAVIDGNKKPILHKLFGSTPGDGEMQPKEGISYSLCGFGQNIICTIIGSYLTVFMTDAIGFSALAVAFLMLFARIFDAMNDPIMGSVVDRTRTKWGKCRPFLKWMAFPIAAMTVICFLPWYPKSDGGFAALSIMYVIWGIIYTVADVPYWGLSTAMSNDTYRRGNLLTIARLFCTAGAGIITVFVPIITDNLTKGLAPAAASEKLRMIYFIIAIIGCVIALPLFFLGFKNTTERNQSLEAPPSLKHNLKLLFKNKPLLLIVLSGIGGAARMLFTYTGGLYFAKYVMGKESMYSIFTMAIVPGGLIASVLVPFFTKKFGKRNTYIWSHVVGGIAMLIAFIVGIACDHGNYSSTVTTVVLIIALVIAGIPTGFGNILTYAMIGDTVEYLELKTGERAEGICFAMQTLMNKIGMAVGAFVGVLAYYMAGISANDVASVSPQGKDTMWVMLVLIAAISFFLTIIPLFFYKFNEKQQQEAVEEIKKRKAALAGNDNLALETAEERIEAAVHGYAPLEVFPNEDGAAVPLSEISEEPEQAVAEAETQFDEPDNDDRE